MNDSRSTDSMGFLTTQWSLVMGASDASIGDRRTALGELCQRYWLPLYAYLRRRGKSEPEAQDLVQGFFTHLLEKETLQSLDASKGRFRAFMLAALKHYVSNERDRSQTLKRGGRVSTLSIDFAIGERWYQHEPVDEWTAEKLFEHRWALSLMDNVMERLRQRFVQQDRSQLFEALAPHLVRDPQKLPYANIAQELNCSVASLKSTMHRMKGWYRELMLDEIAQTVCQEAVAEELQRLLKVLSQKS